MHLWCAKVDLHKGSCELSILGLLWNSRGVGSASPLAEMKRRGASLVHRRCTKCRGGNPWPSHATAVVRFP